MYLVVMPNSWGRGETLAQARSIARRHGGHRGSVKWIAFHYDPLTTPEVYIDEMGSLMWRGVKPVRVEHATDPLTETAKKALRPPRRRR